MLKKLLMTAIEQFEVTQGHQFWYRSKAVCDSPLVSMLRAIDGFAPTTDSAAPSTDASMAQQSVDGAALSVDAHGTDSVRSVDRAAPS